VPSETMAPRSLVRGQGVHVVRRSQIPIAQVTTTHSCVAPTPGRINTINKASFSKRLGVSRDLCKF
jgi:hypothetical protein